VTDEAPIVHTFEHEVPAVTIAADSKTDVVESPYSGTVTAVNFVPIAAIVGADTNSRTLSLVNKGQAGAGTTVVATKALVAAAGTLAADTAAPVTLSVVAGATTVALNDVLEWQSNHVGTGIVDPGGMIHVEVTRLGASYPG